MSNTVVGRRQFDNSQECIAKKRQWRRHANENTPEQNASILNGPLYRGLKTCLRSHDYVMLIVPFPPSPSLSSYHPFTPPPLLQKYQCLPVVELRLRKELQREHARKLLPSPSLLPPLHSPPPPLLQKYQCFPVVGP